MYCDYHTHTPLCLHASGTPQEYVQAAVRAGLREYGISDHAPMPGEPFDDWRMKQADMPAYLDWLTEARECAAPHGLTVRSALECDWFPGIEPWIEHLQGLHAWDYLIGSVHYLGEKREFDNPHRMDFWHRTDVEDAWEQYWERFRNMAASGMFHIMGHAGPDLKNSASALLETCAVIMNRRWKPCGKPEPAWNLTQPVGTTSAGNNIRTGNS